MKHIGFSIPCYNEEKNISILYAEIIEMMEKKYPQFSFSIQFIDNASTDKTQEVIEELCKKDKRVKAIFNIKNYPEQSAYYGLLHTEGDCVIFMFSDLQDPLRVVEEFIRRWSEGKKIIVGAKEKEKENWFIYKGRQIFYGLMRILSDKKGIAHFVGFGLYDREFIEVLKKIPDPLPQLRNVIPEYGRNIEIIKYEQDKRKYGKSHHTLYSYYCSAMSMLVGSTEKGIHFICFIGCLLSLASILVSLFYLIYKLLFWNSFAVGMAPLAIGLFFLSSVQIFLIGIVGEYVLNLKKKIVIDRDIIIEKTINIDVKKQNLNNVINSETRE